MKKCACCNKQSERILVFKAENVYISCELLSSEARNLAGGGGNITLSQCLECGYIENETFDEEKMSEAYRSEDFYQTKNFTPRLSRHILEIKESILKYAKKDAVVVEIAPGQCDLALSLAHDVKNIYTIDPSPISKAVQKVSNIKHIQGFFSKEFLQKEVGERVDFVIFRHLLEHIFKPFSFLENVSAYLEDGAFIYIEVPNALDIFRHKRFFDIYHDHCGYYQKASIINVMASLGCEFVEEVYYFDYQHLGLFFKKNAQKRFEREGVVIYDYFTKESFELEIKRLNKLCEKYEKIGIYGGGVQAHSLLNHLSAENYKKIVCAFEINEDKVGKYMRDTNILIQYPSKESLELLDCLIMAIPSHENHAYHKEILDFVKQGAFKGDLIRMAKGVELIQFKE